MNRFCFLFLVTGSLLSCSAPEGLNGSWLAERQECLFKGNEGQLLNKLDERKKYILNFKGDYKVDLIYENLSISADFYTIRGLKKEINAEDEIVICDLIYEGKYSYLAGSITFEFTDKETGEPLGARVGEDCDIAADEVKFKALPTNSVFRKNSTTEDKSHVGEVVSVGSQELRLAFPSSLKCKNDKLITVFSRK